MKLLCALFIGSLAVSCSHRLSAERERISNDLNGLDTLENYSGLTFTARFDECGEWGGHRETVEIIREGQTLAAVYKVFPYNCDSIDYYYTRNDLQPRSERRTKITPAHISAMSDYIKQLCTARLEQSFPGHAGAAFGVTDKNSSLFINVYSSRGDTRKNFQNFVKFLFP